MFNPSVPAPPRAFTCSLKLLTILSLFSIPFSRIVRRAHSDPVPQARFRPSLAATDHIIAHLEKNVKPFFNFISSYYIYAFLCHYASLFLLPFLFLCRTLFCNYGVRMFLTSRPHATYIQSLLLFLHSHVNTLGIDFHYARRRICLIVMRRSARPL